MEGGPFKALRASVMFAATVLGKMHATYSESARMIMKVPYLRAGLLPRLQRQTICLYRCMPARREIQAYARNAEGDLLVAEGGDVGRTEFAPGRLLN